MSDRLSLQKFWSMTDKPLIDMLNRKAGQSSATTDEHRYSNRSDSEESSSGYFVAVPEEFRPYFIPQPKQKTLDVSYNTKPPSPDSKSVRGQKPTMYPNESRQNANFRRFPVNDESAENQNDAPGSQCKQTMSTNHNLNSIRETIDNNKNIQIKMNNTPVLNTKVSQETHTRPVNNLPSFQKQHRAPLSKPPNRNKECRMQSQHSEKSEPGTIRINFELPSKNSSLNVKLEYTTKFSSEMESKTEILRNELPRFKTKDHHLKGPYGKTLNFQKNTVQRNNELGQDKQNYCDKSKIQWKITEEKYAYSSARNKFKSKQPINDSKLKQTYENRKPLKEKSHRENFNNSLQTENIRQTTVENHTQLKQPKIKIQEKVYHEVISFYKENFQEDTLKYVGNKIPEQKSAYSNANNKSSMQSTIKSKNELDFKSPSSPLSDTAQKLQENLHLDISCGHFSGPQNFDHTKLKDIEKKTNISLDCNFKSKNFNNTKVIDREEKDMYYYGKEMSDLIIGSHDALSMFFAIYKEWIITRQELIEFLEQLERNLNDSSKKFTKYNDILKYAKFGITIVSTIPNPHISVAARIVSLFTTLFSNFLDKPKNTEIDNSPEITSLLFKDSHSSTDLYMYGLQCNQQFEETVKIIEEFYSKVKNYEILTPNSGEIKIFIQGILEYKPTHRVFYKKLHKCFQELLQMDTKSDSRRFCEPFFLYSPTSADVIGFLNWRFRSEDFSPESVQHELEQIHKLITDSNNTSLKDLIARLQNCLRIMKEELTFVEKCLMEVSLFDTTSKQPVKKV